MFVIQCRVGKENCDGGERRRLGGNSLRKENERVATTRKHFPSSWQTTHGGRNKGWMMGWNDWIRTRKENMDSG